MSFARVLYELPTERLREIVRRRAATLRGIPRIDDKRALARFLAEALSLHSSVIAALNNTNLLELRTLLFLILHEGEVPFAEVVKAVGEEHRARLEAAVEGLEANGLALRTVQEGHPVLFVPGAVRERAPLPLPLRYRLPHALQKYDAATILHLYECLALPQSEALNHATRIAAIVRELTDPERLRARVARLSKGAQETLEFVMRQNGVTTLTDLASRLEARHRNQLLSFGWNQHWKQGKPRNPVEELLAQGLLVMESSVGWGYGHLLIPGDLMGTLLGQPLLGDWTLAEPEWETIPASSTPISRHETLARDIAYLLGYLGRTDAARTGKGIMHRSVFKTLARGLTVPTPHYAAFVYALSREADLIAAQGRNNLYNVTRQGLAWLEQSPETQLNGLYDVWRNQTAWAESCADPLADATVYYNAETIRAYRDCARSLLTDLARERPDELASFRSLAARARFRWWSRFPAIPPPGAEDNTEDTDNSEADSPTTLTLLHRLCAESLYWLGLTEIRQNARGVPTHVRLSPLGRRRLLGEEENAAAIPVSESFIVQPNLEIYAPPNLAPRLLYRLFRITNPSGNGLLTLNGETLRRALDRGETAGGLLEFLRAHSQTGVPQNVEYLIHEIGERHGHIKVGQAGLYIQVSDPQLLKELKAQKKLGIHFRGQLADTVALITGDSVEAVLRQLRQAGYFPVNADEQEDRRPSTAPGSRRVQPAPRPEKAAPSEIETRIDWEAVAASDGLPWETSAPTTAPSESVTAQKDIVALLSRAIREHLCVEIEYQRNDWEPRTERIIEPRGIVGSLVSAHCRLRHDDRQFNLRYIRQARLTGETFETRE